MVPHRCPSVGSPVVYTKRIALDHFGREAVLTAVRFVGDQDDIAMCDAQCDRSILRILFHPLLG